MTRHIPVSARGYCRPGRGVAASSGRIASRCSGWVKVPAIFGSHMVLQRDQKDRVWGWADPGEEVTVKIGGQSHTTKAGAERGPGRLCSTRCRPAGRIPCRSRARTRFGLTMCSWARVWLCSGQSNMEWSMASAKDADLEIATAKYPEIRLITVPQVGTQDPQKDFKGRWQLCEPKTVGEFSAVGYFSGAGCTRSWTCPLA